MEPYAIVETGGKQYLVKQGDSLQVERLSAEVGAKVALDSVLAVSDGKELQVGTPMVKGAKVAVEVVEHVRGPKVVSFVKRRRKGSQRKVGHRQELTVLKVADVSKA
ncbi:MAG: 50S ribosomal protein L21 [Lentisphaerales bacterium]|jgi:large subunit ribosomal protein L21|nr:MAG: 50S ribosomal protein L21 [Lentisphaerales bacterium]